MFRKAPKAYQIHQKWDFLTLEVITRISRLILMALFRLLGVPPLALRTWPLKFRWHALYILSHHLKKAVVVYPDKSLHLFHLQIPHM